MAQTDREKALDTALAQIEKQFGRGAIMRLGEESRTPIEVIPTGAIALDAALGIGGLPRGRIVEIYGPEASGKCLTADALIPTNWGLLTVAEIFQRCGSEATCTSRTTDVAHLGLRVVNEYGRMEPVSALTHNNRKPTLRITTSAGRSVTVTHNHPIRVLNEQGNVVWRRAGRVAVGDVVLGVLGGDPDVKDQITVGEATVLGYLVGDGHVKYPNRVMFSQVDRQVTAEFRTLVEEVWASAGFKVYDQRPNDVWVIGRGFREHLSETLGLGYHGAATKEIPWTVRASGPQVQRAFLSALFECDGGVESGNVCLSTASETLAVQVQAMLASLGITASRVRKLVAAYPDNVYWTIRLTGTGSRRFVDEIGFRSDRRAPQAEAVRSIAPSAMTEHIPYQVDVVRDLRDAAGSDRAFDRIAGDLFRPLRQAQGSDSGEPFVALSLKRLRRIVGWAEGHGLAEHPLTSHLRSLLARPATYESITTIEDAGSQPTFDLVVPGTHSFVANGLAVHNTSLALHAIASVQQQGGIAAFIDAEHALDPSYAGNLGVELDSLYVAQPDTGEQALEIADTLVRSGAMDLIVIDSVAALVPRAEIEGEMGDSHVGLQARLMSQALRKMAGALSNSNTTAIFINQLREKIGVMFGCFSYNTRVTLADGSQEKIGKIVNQRMAVDVRTYDSETGSVVSRPITNWFNNGPAERFLQFTVERSGGNGRRQFAATENHLIRTPGGWRAAGEILPDERVLVFEQVRLSVQQRQLIYGSLMGDGSLSANPHDRRGVRFRMGHGAKQRSYLDYKASLLGNIRQSRRDTERASFVDLTPLPELHELHEAVYLAGQGKVLSDEYLKALTPLALAFWYMDDGCLTVRSKGLQARTAGGSGRIDFCVEALTPGSRARLRDHLADTWGIGCRLVTVGAAAKAMLRFDTASSRAFQELVAPYIHPSMEYKLLPAFRGRFSVQPEFDAPHDRLIPARVLEIHVKPRTKSMNRFDIEVEGTHNYFVDGVLVHNSPETTTGGRALKFYSSVRLDVRRIETLKGGTEAVGNRVRVKVVKNKVAPPFKQAEFDVLYGQGISREGSLIDLGVDNGIVRKSGAWYTYESDQLGQGKENARAFLRDNPDLANEIEKRIKEQLGIIPRMDAPADEEEPDAGPAPAATSEDGPGGKVRPLVPPTPIDL